MTRQDTGATVSYTTAWVNTSGNVWVGTFVAPVAGLTYAYSAMATISGTARPFSYTYSDVSTGWVGDLTSSTLIQIEGGTVNIAAFSDLSGGETINQTAIQRAGKWAEAYIYSKLKTRYKVPLEWTVAVDPVAEDFATKLAIWKLYGKRGQQDNKAGGDFKDEFERITAELNMYAGGLRHFDATLQDGASLAVTLVEPTTASLSSGAGLYPTNQSRDFGRRYIEGIGVVIQR